MLRAGLAMTVNAVVWVALTCRLPACIRFDNRTLAWLTDVLAS